MMNRVKLLLTALSWRPACSPHQVALLDASGVGQAAPVTVELLSSGVNDPPEWVRFLAPGVNRGRTGRVFTVLSADKVAAASTAWKGAIDLICCFEHQFDRSRENGQPAPAAAWIKELSATGPDGSPGIWARVEWLPGTAQLIRDRKYRYLSAVIEHDAAGNVLRVLRATLTNQPEMDTATALFSAHPNKEPTVNLLQKLLAAFGLAATTTEDDAVKHASALATLCAALAKQVGIEVAALSAMTVDQVTSALQKPLAEKLATLSATAKVGADAAPDAIVAGIRALGMDPSQHVTRAVYDDVVGRLAALTAETKTRLIDEAAKAGRLTPKQREFAETLTPEQLTAFLSTAPIVVNGQQQQQQHQQVATLSADEKAQARQQGVTDEAFLAAKQDQAAFDARFTG